MKNASQIMDKTSANEIGLALIYIERERQMCNHMRDKDISEVARKEGFLKGVLVAARLLGIENFYGSTITNLRFAIQEENKIKN